MSKTFLCVATGFFAFCEIIVNINLHYYQKNKFEQEKAVVSVSRHNCLKRPPAVPLGWCQKRTVGAVLVKMAQFCRLLGGLGGVFGGVDRKNVV